MPLQDRPERAATGAVRRAVLAVMVLDDVDLEVHDEGVLVPGARPLSLPWEELAAAAGPDPDDLDRARAAIAAHLRIRRALDDVAADPSTARTALRLLAMPVPLVPDAGWALRQVPGGALAVGLGIALDRTDTLPVVPVPSLALASAGLAPGGFDGDVLEEHLEAMGTLAAARLARVPQQLVPVGDSDVPTLLASRSFRRALTGVDAVGMRGAVVPSRRRGWLDPRRLDAAFARVAHELTDAPDRAFERPLLVTVDEVGEVGRSGPVEIDLRDARRARSRR